MGILNLPVSEERFIKTGIADIDKKLRGMKKEYVSVISGLRAVGKSSAISEMVLDGVESGNNIGVLSGKLASKNSVRWMSLQAAEKGYTEPAQFEGYYNVQRKHQERIVQWLGEYFQSYSNEYRSDFQAVVDQFKRKTEKDKLDMLILDSLMAFDIFGMPESKFEAQIRFVLALRGGIAKPCNMHIMFVAHPGKVMGSLRSNDIPGTADLGNAVDNASIIHRVDQDFKRLSRQMFGWRDDNQIYQAVNVIEVAKDCDDGAIDYFIPLHYEPETKRLKNYSFENEIYGWSKTGNGFTVVHGEIPFDWTHISGGKKIKHLSNRYAGVMEYKGTDICTSRVTTLSDGDELGYRIDDILYDSMALDGIREAIEAAESLDSHSGEAEE